MLAWSRSIIGVGASSLDRKIELLAQEFFHTVVGPGSSFFFTEVDVIMLRGTVSGMGLRLVVLWFSLEKMDQSGKEARCFFFNKSTIHGKKRRVFHLSPTCGTERATLARIRVSLMNTRRPWWKESTDSMEESTLASMSFCRIASNLFVPRSLPFSWSIVAILYSLIVSDRVSYVLTVKIAVWFWAIVNAVRGWVRGWVRDLLDKGTLSLMEWLL